MFTREEDKRHPRYHLKGMTTRENETTPIDPSACPPCSWLIDKPQCNDVISIRYPSGVGKPSYDRLTIIGWQLLAILPIITMTTGLDYCWLCLNGECKVFRSGTKSTLCLRSTRSHKWIDCLALQERLILQLLFLPQTPKHLSLYSAPQNGPKLLEGI